MSTSICTFERSRRWLYVGVGLALVALAFLPFITALASVPYQAEATIYGYVKVDSDSGPPPETAVDVLIPGTTKKIRTGTIKSSKGDYEISGISPGPYDLLAHNGGSYHRQVIRKIQIVGKHNRIDFKLRHVTTPGEVSGFATSLEGRILAGATVILYPPECRNCELARTTTDESGRYKFTNLAAPENYRVAVGARVADGSEAVAFITQTVHVRADKQVALHLEVTGSGSAMSVVGNMPGLDDPYKLNDILIARRFIPPTNSDIHREGHTGSVQVDGASGSENTFILNGQEVTNFRTGSLNTNNIPSRFVQEVQSRSSGFEAEFGGASGGVINVTTRSGTNAFHGNVQYDLMNDALDARDFFNLPGFETFRSHAGSGSLGGPLHKDHVFFFVGHQLARGAQSPTFSPLLVSQSPVLNQRLIRLGLPAEDLRSRLTTTAKDFPQVRLDFQPNAEHSVILSYNLQRDLRRGALRRERGGTSSAPSAALDVLEENQHLSIKYSAILSANVVGEILYGYRQAVLSSDPVHPQQLSLLIPGLAQIGRPPNLDNGERDRYRRHLFSGKVIVHTTKHDLSFGGEVGLENRRFRLAAFDSGRAVVSNLAALAATPPRAELFQIGNGGTQVGFDSSVVGLYLQDRYSVLKNLTLSLGLRYKAEIPPSFRLKDLKGWQPRLGFAWDISGKGRTAIRGSYGIFHDRLPQIPIAYELLIGGDGLRPNAPVPVRHVDSFTSTQATSALGQFLNTSVAPSGPPLAVIYDLRSRSPLVHSGNLLLEHSLGWRNVVSLAYNYRRGSRLLTSTNTNLPPPSLVGGRPDFADRFVNPAFAQIYQFGTEGRSSYHSGTARAELRPLKDKLQIRAGYTFSKSLDDVPVGSFEATPENVFDRRGERAPSDLHAPHEIFVDSSWEIPRLVNVKLGRLPSQLSYIVVGETFRFNSGRFFNVLTGSDSNRDGNPLTDRPLGVGRNTFYGQSYAQLDTFARARFKLRGETYLDITAHVFNLLNRANFASFNTVLGQEDLSGVNPSIVFGKRGLPGYDFRRPLTPEGFGIATSAFTPRRFQLGLRFSF